MLNNNIQSQITVESLTCFLNNPEYFTRALDRQRYFLITNEVKASELTRASLELDYEVGIIKTKSNALYLGIGNDRSIHEAGDIINLFGYDVEVMLHTHYTDENGFTRHTPSFGDLLFTEVYPVSAQLLVAGHTFSRYEAPNIDDTLFQFLSEWLTNNLDKLGYPIKEIGKTLGIQAASLPAQAYEVYRGLSLIQQSEVSEVFYQQHSGLIQRISSEELELNLNGR